MPGVRLCKQVYPECAACHKLALLALIFTLFLKLQRAPCYFRTCFSLNPAVCIVWPWRHSAIVYAGHWPCSTVSKIHRRHGFNMNFWQYIHVHHRRWLHMYRRGRLRMSCCGSSSSHLALFRSWAPEKPLHFSHLTKFMLSAFKG